MKNENFIPVSIHKLTIDILQNETDDKLKKIFSLITAIYNYNLNKEFNLVKESYQLFNPDLELIIDETRDKNDAQNDLLARVDYLLQKANYTKLSIVDIENSLNSNPNSGLNIIVDVNDYEIFDVYYRGDTTVDIIKKSLLNYIIKPKKVNIKIYKKLFIVAKLKDFNVRAQEISRECNISYKKSCKKLHKTYKKLPKNIDSNLIFFKLFKDIPHPDLEMLFFVQKIRLKLFDKIKLIITGAFSTITGIVSAIGKILVALNPLAIIGAIGGLIAIIVKQIMGLFNQHNKYKNTLTSSLYFQSLDNNLGAINYIGNSASEEEIKELILGYYFKLKNPSATENELDIIIENHLQQTYKILLDFDIEDSITKMQNLGLIADNKAVNTKDSLNKLNQIWDDIFI
jgi:hypothetical protein